MFNASEELAHAPDFPDIRTFTVALLPSDKLLYDLPGITEQWSLPSNCM